MKKFLQIILPVFIILKAGTIQKSGRMSTEPIVNPILINSDNIKNIIFYRTSKTSLIICNDYNFEVTDPSSEQLIQILNAK
ncbi:MAG: hypothetical protein ACRCTQ_03075 [Brevinemataceae bacterium]